jgi:hypothetical protein
MHYVQTYEEYVDFEQEIVTFNDKLDTSIKMRLTFKINNEQPAVAYIELFKNNELGELEQLGESFTIDTKDALCFLAQSMKKERV